MRETGHCTNGSQSLQLKSKTASSCQKAFDGLSLGGSRPVGGPGADPRGGPGAFWNPAHQNINNTHLNQVEWKHSDLPSLMNGLISTEILLLLSTWGIYTMRLHISLVLPEASCFGNKIIFMVLDLRFFVSSR